MIERILVCIDDKLYELIEYDMTNGGTRCTLCHLTRSPFCAKYCAAKGERAFCRTTGLRVFREVKSDGNR